MAAKTAAEPSISAETLAILSFPAAYPISIVIAVPIMLQGPPSINPINNKLKQKVQATSVSAQETINITAEAKINKGLKNNARYEYLSPKYPTIIPPIKEPKSTMEAMYPFCQRNPLLSKYVGSQNSNPQIHPFVHAYPITQKGTLGRKRAENTFIYFFGVQVLSLLFDQFQLDVRTDLFYGSLAFFSSSSSSYYQRSKGIILSSMGFYLSRATHNIATPIVKPPVTKKLVVQFPWSY